MSTTTIGRKPYSTFLIKGLCCSDEEAVLRKRLSKHPGIQDMKFNLVAQKLYVQHTAKDDEILKEIRAAGFKADTAQTLIEDRPFLERHSQTIFTTASGLLWAAGLTALYGFGAEPQVTTPLFIIAILLGGWRIAMRGYYAVRSRSLDMNTLMTVAVLGAAAIGEWAEAATVVFLFSLALLLETLSTGRARKAIRSLIDLTPHTARLVRGQSEESVPVQDIAIGERILIKPGDRIPLDGDVIKGNSTVNQAPITGESAPAEKRAGDRVFAGTINLRGALEVGVTAAAEHTTLAQIIHLVEEAQSKRAPAQQFVDRFARVYTPAVLLLAVGVALVPPLVLGLPFGDWFYRALVLLVIACPCALVISTPITMVSALTNAARSGILIKGGAYLEALASIRTFVFDKTGTLTEGNLSVTDVVPLNSAPRGKILAIAASLERYSEHHIAGAVMRALLDEDMSPDIPPAESFRAVTGKGVMGQINGIRYGIGNHQFCEEEGRCGEEVHRELERLEADGKTALVLWSESEAVSVIGVADRLRTDVRSSLEAMRGEGVNAIVMLTGDNQKTAQAIATQLGIDRVHSELLPEDKLQIIEKLKSAHRSDHGSKIAMVGDGINDAPALAAADVGIAMGTAGSDTAIETADIALMGDDLTKLAYLKKLSAKTVRVIRQNIALSLAIKLVFLALAVPGYATLWMAITADEGAALIVIANGLRLLRMK
jgi:Zn2+/Cd2+-exporting ATPase